jgi:hypothetical protein
MESLSRLIAKLIRSDEYGGRTLQTDEHTIVLYDYGVWTDAHSHAIHSRFPECDICVMQSHASLSGFIVVFKMQRDRTVYAWMTLVLGILALILLTGRQMVAS